jgi:DNA-binding NtrC family response regulator
MPARNTAPFSVTAWLPSQDRLDEIRRYSAVRTTLLITGETGVGKDALARHLHLTGPGHREPFVSVDCPALPETLIEVELFGHERGAFTDATGARPGRFELAGRGTLYLDAVSDLSAAGQAALLRVVEERLVTRLGGTRTMPVQARIIASADASIDALVARGQFRLDLFHRLSVLSIHIPPLRARPTEILPLAQRFVTDICRRLKRPRAVITGACADALVRYQWPGNVRELQHVLERVLLTLDGNRIDASHLPPGLLEDGDEGGSHNRPLTLSEMERRYIETTLRRTRGNQTRAAAILGISRKALWEKRRRFGLG